MYNAILFNDTSDEMHQGCNLVINSIKKLLKKNKIRLIYSIPSSVDWSEDLKLKEIINKSKINLIIVNGEGSIHHDSFRAFNLIKVGYLGKKLKVKTFLINCTFASNNKITRDSLENFDLISVREKRSMLELNKINIKSIVVPDLSFYSNFDKYNNNAKNYKSNNITLSDSVFIKDTISLYKFSKKNKYNFYPILSFYKINFFNLKSWLGLLKFVFKNLTYRLFRIKNYSNYYFRYYGTLTPNNYVKKILNSKLFITGRYHSVCIAIMLRKPFISLKSNTFKIEELLNDIGINRLRVLDNLNSLDDIINRDDINCFTQSESLNIEKYLFNAKNKIEDLFILIKKHL
ncbi:polysaccharide pyruvyl transferase family protein [Pelagibacteraceae bacterium]|nr:polysaccharide pyruvyl transferase family protein [Pelagibacteraceae bacterium]